MTTQQESPRTADHWWWRPGWTPGRRFYTWHCTFQEQPGVHALAAAYRASLAPLGCLDVVPDSWLHLTMQGVGFVDDVTTSEIHGMVAAARQRLADVPAFTIDLDRPTFTPEAIRWDPEGPVDRVRSAIRDAIGSVWEAVPEPAESFTAHITIAYANEEGPADAILGALAGMPSIPTVARIDSAELIVLNRDNKMYEWETYASLPLRQS